MLFPSKKDVWLSLVVWGISLIGIVVTLINGQLTTVLLMLLFALILLWFWFKTDYRIEADSIIIRYGPVRQTVHIHDIKLIIKAKKPFTAPALSMDRIQITCGRFDVVSISPVNQQKFIEKLLEVNSNIEVDKRLGIISKGV